MTLTPRYLVNTRTLVVSNEAGFVTEYRPVYQKNIEVYKGIDNTLEFQILNADQKPQQLSDKLVKFVAFDENKNLVIDHTGSILNANKGLVSVIVTENDLLNLQQQYLSYNVYLVDNITDNKIITYADEQLNATGTIRVSNSAFPGPREAHVVNSFTETELDSDIFLSEAITAEPAVNGNEALHTAVYYLDGYVGSITIQATLENHVTQDTSWADVVTTEFDGTETEPVPVNFNGVYSYMRFKTDASSSTITKILVRN